MTRYLQVHVLTEALINVPNYVAIYSDTLFHLRQTFMHLLLEYMCIEVF